VVSVKRQGGARARRGNNRQGFVDQPSDEDQVDDDAEDAVDRWRR
jgi:hypothetical protein